MKAIIYVGIIFFVFNMLGCSKTPSKSEAKAYLESKIKGVAELISFKKIDGEEKEWMGSKMYVMRCETTTKSLKDFSPAPFFTIPKGHIEHRKDIYIWFRKTEKGWTPAGMSDSPDFF